MGVIFQQVNCAETQAPSLWHNLSGSFYFLGIVYFGPRAPELRLQCPHTTARYRYCACIQGQAPKGWRERNTQWGGLTHPLWGHSSNIQGERFPSFRPPCHPHRHAWEVERRRTERKKVLGVSALSLRIGNYFPPLWKTRGLLLKLSFWGPRVISKCEAALYLGQGILDQFGGALNSVLFPIHLLLFSFQSL